MSRTVGVKKKLTLFARLIKFFLAGSFTCEEPNQDPGHDRGHRVVVNVQKRNLVVLLAQHEEKLPKTRIKNSHKQNSINQQVYGDFSYRWGFHAFFAKKLSNNTSHA